MLGNKNKYGKLFVPLSLCANSIGHPITDMSLEILPMTPLDSKNPINKFKEIRSLAIRYKEGKDVEIKNLNKELDNFKKTIEENNSLYESMLDKTTQSLEKIISNTESLSKIQ